MTPSQLYIPRLKRKVVKRRNSWLKQSNLAQYSSPEFTKRYVFLRDALARLKHIISADRGSILYTYSPSILRERLLTCQRREVPVVPPLLLRSRVASPNIVAKRYRCYVTDVYHKRRRFTFYAVRRALGTEQRLALPMVHLLRNSPTVVI